MAPVHFLIPGARCWGTCMCAAALPRVQPCSAQYFLVAADMKPSFRNFIIPNLNCHLPIPVVFCQAASNLGSFSTNPLHCLSLYMTFALANVPRATPMRMLWVSSLRTACNLLTS